MYFCFFTEITMAENESWFASWFDTTYYHILYQNRDESEAQLFIGNLIQHLQLSDESVLDLACGKGRHAKYLSELGLNVMGVDLSAQSIDFASQHSHNGLSFQVHDMRDVIPNVEFDVIFNLFTSFGYFDDDLDNHKVLQSVSNMLKPGGRLVIDFMNAVKVINKLVLTEKKDIEGIRFDLKRSYDGKFIHKYISFEDAGVNHSYKERVRAFKLEDFQHMLSFNGFNVIQTFGDFNLNPFDENMSDRLIIVAQKQ